MRGRSIRIFLVDGEANGIKIAEVSNWTGKVIYAPRTKLSDIKKRPEIIKSGVYILLGPDPDAPGDGIVYFGEGDVVWKRIESHNRDDDKEFWTEFAAFSSKDENLTKAHTRYLEARMIDEARKNSRFKLKNSTLPDLPPLPEADKADMEVFLDHIKLLLLSLGVRVFDIVEMQKAEAKLSKTDKFILTARGALATGYDVSDGFLVEKDSTAVKKDNPSLQKWYIQQKNKLLETEKLINHSEELYIFSEDIIFFYKKLRGLQK